MEKIDHPDYQKMYLALFNHVTDALEQLAAQNFGQARQILICAQQEAEEAYLQRT